MQSVLNSADMDISTSIGNHGRLAELKVDFGKYSNWMDLMSRESFFEYYKMPELNSTYVGEHLFSAISSGKKTHVTFPEFAKLHHIFAEGDIDDKATLFLHMYSSQPEFELITRDDLKRYVTGFLTSMMKVKTNHS